MARHDTGSEERTRVLVVGCGIAGGALAAFLEERAGIEYDVVEVADAFERIGYGVSLWANGVSVLDDLDVLEDVTERGTTPEKIRLRTASGRADSTLELPAIGAGPQLVAVHRADLHDALLVGIPRERIEFGTTVTAVREEPDAVTVELTTGERRTYDLVVGADGIRSAVREHCFEGEQLRHSETAVWSFWTDADGSFPEVMTSVSGPSTEAFLVAIGDRGLVNVGTKRGVEADEKPTTTELRRALSDLGWILPETLERRRGELFADTVREVSMDRWVSDRIALVGDAAHAVHPIAGMGAALALEDARALSRWLASLATVPAAVDQYYLTRREPVRAVQRDAALMERFVLAESRFLRAIRDGLLTATPVLERVLERRLRELAA
ncbi:FAD-dependent oxidoreductase [Natronococcus occultus]|nr:NAD(P)/FAD-dependent oxidoreductase [Natronococcus occultus]